MPGNVDFSEFQRGLEHFTRELLEALAEGMGQAGMQLLNDSANEIPTVPFDIGNLRGSGSVFVSASMLQANAVLVGTSQTGPGTPALADENIAEGGEIVCRVGYNTVYAAVMHEGRWETGPLAGVEVQNYSEAGSGKFYLQRPLEQHGREYIEMAANHAKRKLGM